MDVAPKSLGVSQPQGSPAVAKSRSAEDLELITTKARGHFRCPQRRAWRLGAPLHTRRPRSTLRALGLLGWRWKGFGMHGKIFAGPPRPLHPPQIRHTPTWAQRLAALWYVWAFGGGIYSWLFAIWLCSLLPPLWLVLAGYTAWVLTRGAEAPRRGTYPTPLKRWGLWRLLAAYFPAHLHKTADLPPGKPHIFCYHPHGILSFSAWLSFASEALGFSQLFPGLDVRILTLSINFRNPFFREYLLLHGSCAEAAVRLTLPRCRCPLP